jgi:hypothetical protein
MNPRAARRFDAYYRVTTDRQGRSSLGLEAQQKAVTDCLNGSAWELVGEFVEVESSKRSDRLQLGLALEACRKNKARLVIAKLDGSRVTSPSWRPSWILASSSWRWIILTPAS